jgi:prepilin-type N-terminal cleavage/methylation domain-containing protein
MNPIPKSSRLGWKAFTLIELLIVVAIIAILAAIAVPNFLEAQVRAKVSRVKSDLRTLATGLESYFVDNNKYPPTPVVDDGGIRPIRIIPNLLSTPISYVTIVGVPDPFIGPNLQDFQYFASSGDIYNYTGIPTLPLEPGFDPLAGRRYYYQSNRDPRRSEDLTERLPGIIGTYSLAAQADARKTEGEWVLASYGPNRKRDFPLPLTVLEPYDPTNGTISGGDIVRTQMDSEGKIKD